MNPVKNIRTGVSGNLEGDVFLGFFDTYICFMITEAAPLEYVERCAGHLDSMSDELIEQLCAASIRYCNDHLADIGKEPREFARPRDVLRLITPSTLIVPDPENGDEPIIHLWLECAWEVEHGMEWVARGEHALYVGSFNDMDPWADYTQKDSGNYA